jgi:hypothetical protein
MLLEVVLNANILIKSYPTALNHAEPWVVLYMQFNLLTITFVQF